MTPRKPDHERLKELLIELVDGHPSEEQLDELQQVANSVPDGLERMVDHLLLDSLLSDDLGRESLTALVDLVAEPDDSDVTGDSGLTQFRTESAAKSPVPGRRSAWFLRTTSWLAVAASVALVVFLLTGHGDNPVYASASQIVEAAIHTHAEPIERVYVVEVKRNPSDDNGLNLPRDVKVSTQGDRFWVEVDGVRRWAWGRDADGAIWVTVGPRRAVRIESNEAGQPLQYYADIYSLRIESLLNDVLEHFDLKRTATENLTHVIIARSRGGRPRWLRSATIEVDVETKAVRRLVVEREYDGKSSVVTFTLVEARTADESKYGLQGYLEAPFHVYSQDLEPEKRREALVEWFGPHASYWIK